MDLKKIYSKKTTIRNYLIIGAIMGLLSAYAEYLLRLNTNDQQLFIPLMFRAMLTAMLIAGSVVVFELLYKDRFTQKTFLYLVIVRSIFYTITATLWLVIINGAWFAIKGGNSVKVEITKYLSDDVYLINLLSIFIFIIVIVSVGQIDSLHRRGELVNFILGRYNKPREIERIFCFIDLKGSTTIAEKLGHFDFAWFLKDYYSDITEALRKTNAQIYQYVGDEVILTWSFKKGLEDNNAIHCFFEMKKIIHNLKAKYMAKYGVYPEFKAGLHGGKVIVTWVGELKKEITYIGDIVNTTARIQEACKRLDKEFLISEELLNSVSGLGNVKASFVEETIPRGRMQSVRLHSLEYMK